jgi:hypothetical protein
MSVYRRNEFRCQRWGIGTWADCPIDEPETKPRDPDEGMVVVRTNDFDAEGPAIIKLNEVLKSNQ